MDSFFPKPDLLPSQPEVVAPKTKKRKIQEEKKDDHIELKQKARLYCTCSEQWKIISKYNPDKLKTWVDEKEFDQTKALHDTVFSFTQRIIGFALDSLSMGDDYVNTEIQNDISLRQAIEIEAGNWVAFLSNRFKILALLSVDVANGKLKQREENKSTVTIVEQENGSNNPGVVKQEEGSGEVPGDIDQAEYCDLECPEGERKDDMSCEPVM